MAAASIKIFVFVFLFLSTVQVFGQLEGNPENWCRNGAFPRESKDYLLGTIKGKKGERIYFYGDDGEDCPQGKNCRRRSYVVPGNEVIVSRKFGGFACAWFQPARGAETVGWIPLDKVEFIEMLQDGGPQAWRGSWKFYDSTIRIAETAQKNIYKVTGDAYWKGLGDNIHIGELNGEAKYADSSLVYGGDESGEYDCRVTMRLLGRFMIVTDNLKCGGANVTFSGVYRRAK